MDRWREQRIVDHKAIAKAGAQGSFMVWPDEEFGDSDFRFEKIIIEETGYALISDCYNSQHSRLVGPY